MQEVAGKPKPPSRRQRAKELVYRRPKGKIFDITPTGDTVDEATWSIFEALCPNRRVLLYYSTGKDSVAAWWALKKRGYTVVPIFRQIIPGLSFFDSAIAAHEAFFGDEVQIATVSPTFIAGRLQFFRDQLDMAAMSEADKERLGGDSRVRNRSFIENSSDALMLENDCDVAVIGTKASDSLHRRTHFKVDGPYTASERLFALNWRLAKNAPFDIMLREKIPIPRYYIWLGRSPELFLEYEFYYIKRYYPHDYQRLLEFFPLLDAWVVRHEHAANGKRLLHMTRPPKNVVAAFEAGHPFV